ncbi:MAG: exopolyphosphatase, partial [Candidatus Nanopelagicales bacterium]
MRVAAIDCGTNSIRLLVADVDGGHLSEVYRQMIIVRLGEGVDRTGAFSDAALARTFSACDTYAEVIDDLGASRVRFVATSASRDVSN